MNINIDLINIRKFKFLKILSILFLFLSLILGVPRFAVENGATCTLCHVNPTGGGLRNDFGTTVYAQDNLPLEVTKNFADKDWDGFIGNNLQIGGDLRVQSMIYTDEENNIKNPIFPMQTDLYANLEINEKASIYFKLNLADNFRQEYWVLFSILPGDGWLRIGRTIPDFGFKLDDHTSFIRGGNARRSHGLQREGMLFSPSMDYPGIIEFGADITNTLSITSSLSNGFATGFDAGYGFTESFSDKNFTSKILFTNTYFELLNLLFSMSYMKEQDFNLFGVAGGFSFNEFTFLAEKDWANNLPGVDNADTFYSEVIYKPKQGLQVIGKYDYFQYEKDLQADFIRRYTIGLEIFPLNMLEIKFQTRFTILDKVKLKQENKTQPQPEYIIQLHTWF